MTLRSACTILALIWPAGLYAGPPTEFWDRLTDAWLNAIFQDGDPDPLAAMIRDEAHTLPADAGGERYLFGAEGATLRLEAAQPGGAILGGLMQWTGTADTRVPPMSVSFSDGRFTHRSDLTLGRAACKCLMSVEAVRLDGKDMALMGCYLGRGGGYLDYAFAYPDPEGVIHAFLAQHGEAATAAFCVTPDPQPDDQMAVYGGLDIPSGLDPEIQPAGVLIWDAERTGLEAMVKRFGVE